jgi:hypothetical protein
MLDLLFTGNATWFSVPALLGTVLFLIRLVMLMIGGGHSDVHAMSHDGGSDHTDGSTRIISVEALTAAMMGFGWGGLAAMKGTDLSLGWVIAVAFGCAVAMLLLQLVLLRMVSKLHSSGNLSLKQTMGSEGVVYIAIPGARHGKGQVTLVIDQRQRQFNAITAGPELPSQTRVRVVAINDDNTVTVEKAG